MHGRSVTLLEKEILLAYSPYTKEFFNSQLQFLLENLMLSSEALKYSMF